jgi:protein TonB
MTHLNTIEFKFYGFYHRIRQKLEQYWGNSLREKADLLAKQGRRIASDVDKITSLSIHIDTRGNIVKIMLRSTSGVKELDDAAIESFNKAGPFPNPPQGMMKDGVAVIEWGFVVKG